MEDLLKWVRAQVAATKAEMDAIEGAHETADAWRLACARYEVWLRVLHEVTRRATATGLDATRVGAYPAIIHGPYADDGHTYGVSFPDFPGCVSVGDTAGQAVADARNALVFHLDGMREDGDTIPPPSSIYSADADGGILTLVRLGVG